MYQEQSAELVMNENILLQTLGFDVAIDHPHTHVVKCCQLVRGELALYQRKEKQFRIQIIITRYILFFNR
jgi:hypothetical protein